MSNFVSLGAPIWVDDYLYQQTGQPVFGGALLMDAVAEKVAMYGCVWHPTRKTGTINIRKIHFRCGAVTFNAASVLRVSLQDVSATAGPPYQPDGNQDQTANMTTLSANAWNTTGNLSADRTIDLSADSFADANSRWVCVVWEYQTFTAADSIVISSHRPLASLNLPHTMLGAKCLLNTGSWAISQPDAANVVFECDDGTFAFLLGGYAVSAIPSAIQVSSNGAVRRAGMKFKVPAEVNISRLSLGFSLIPNGSDGRLVLYGSDGTSELISVDVDNDVVFDGSLSSNAEIAFPPITLAANTFYRFAFVGGSTTAASIHVFNVNAAAHMDCYPLGQNAYYTAHNGTAWSDTVTQRCAFKVGVDSIHDGALASASGGRGRRR